MIMMMIVYILIYLSVTCINFALDERVQTFFGQFHRMFVDYYTLHADVPSFCEWL